MGYFKTKEKLIEQIKEKYGERFDCETINYIGTHHKITIKCNICGNYIDVIPKNLLYNNIEPCKYCRETKFKEQRLKEIFEAFAKIHNNKYIYKNILNYKNNKQKIEIICPIHGEFKQTINSHLSGNGCRLCKIDKSRGNTEIFINKANIIYNNFFIYYKTKYGKNNKDKIIVTCPIHGDFITTPAYHLNGYGCPKCHKSNIFYEVESVLNKENISYTIEKTFDWLKNTNGFNLYLDFYLPEYNVGIECQGLQHFEIIKYYGGEDKYKTIIENDKIKYDLCINNGINLLYFSNKKNFPLKIEKSWNKYNVITDKNILMNQIKYERKHSKK